MFELFPALVWVVPKSARLVKIQLPYIYKFRNSKNSYEVSEL